MYTPLKIGDPYRVVSQFVILKQVFSIMNNFGPNDRHQIIRELIWLKKQ